MGDEEKEPVFSEIAKSAGSTSSGGAPTPTVRWPNVLPKVRELTAFTALQISCFALPN
jgi:hypothetical protein